MASHYERIEAARDTIRFLCSRSAQQLKQPVPNCPGWTVYNAAVHVGRVGVAWHSMIEATPDDPDSRVRGYADAESRGSGHAPDVLASWALAAVDALDVPAAEIDRPCYFSMTGGAGTVGLWGWHAASELAVHRLDIEAALGLPHEMSDHLALDALTYACEFFLPAMSRVTEIDPGPVQVRAERGGTNIGSATIRAAGNAAEPAVTMTGAPIDLLLAAWGRPHGQIGIDGSSETIDAWRRLPAQAFQFGTWD